MSDKANIITDDSSKTQVHISTIIYFCSVSKVGISNNLSL